MSDRPRIRRPPADRTEPIRNWSTMIGGPPVDGVPAGMAEVVQRSVDLGYRVIDEYVRQGQRAAERMSGRGGPTSPVGEVQDAAAHMTRLASDGLRIWLELFGLAMAGAGGQMAPAGPVSAPAAAAAPANGATAAPTTRVRLAIATRRPVEVAVDLRPEAASAELIAHALRAADADAPPLAGAAFVRDDGGALVLRLAVPDDQPPGIYNGLVIDAGSNRPVGTLSVRIEGA